MPQAIPGVASSSPPASARAGGTGFVRVVSPDQLNAQDAADTATAAAARQVSMQLAPDLGSFIRQRWMMMRNHRNTGNNPWNDRLLRAQRMVEGKYDPEKLHEIKKFGGSEVYSRLVATKCRGATALLRDVYLGSDRPWDITPEPDPPVPADVQASILQLVSAEVQNVTSAGQPPPVDKAKSRYIDLMHAAQQAARRIAMTQADSASNKIDDILQSGGFYDALMQFLVDIPIFPFACIKGPVVKMVPKLTWQNGKPILSNRAQMFWERISPFNLYWSPGASNIMEAEIIERKRLTRSDLNDLLGLPGYDQAAVRAALQDYAMGLREWMDYPDTEQALNEGRESPYLNLSHMIDCAEYHGNVQGSMLLSQGVDPSQIPDLDRDYAVQSWVVGRHTVKTQINPSPRKRHPYYVTSFEKVPGTVAGHGLPDILEDMQEICNAALRATVNNMAIASGPQVVINSDRCSANQNTDDLYPWKRWYVSDDPMTNGREPITFFQPNSNANELMTVYTQVSALADDISAIPRYITGQSISGGAGRTASGLSMLMGNSQKILQTVAANVDSDVIEPALTELYDMIMLTDTTGMLTGEEQVKVNGVAVAIQKETEHQKQLQFLQITNNPGDQAIVGVPGRARVLRALSQSLGLPDDVVPDDDTIAEQVKQNQQQSQMVQQQQQWLAMHGIVPGKPQPGVQEELLADGGPPSPYFAQGGGAPPGQAPPGSPGNTPPQPSPARLSDNAPPVRTFQQQPNRPQALPTHGG